MTWVLAGLCWFLAVLGVVSVVAVVDMATQWFIANWTHCAVCGQNTGNCRCELSDSHDLEVTDL